MAIELFKKATRILFNRPTQLIANARSYLLFKCTRLFGALIFTPAKGIRLGKNVRVQKLSTLGAERPAASISIGDHSVVYEHARIAAFGAGKISIGARNIIGDVRLYSRDSISIGERCVFSWNVFIQDFNPHPIDPSERAKQMVSMTDHFLPRYDGHKPSGAPYSGAFESAPVTVGNDVWFGANCTVLPGANIGSGSIVAASAVVVKGDYPEKSILAGNPARVVKTL